ncbi:MAG: response regulator [Desulfobacterales bacterium]
MTAKREILILIADRNPHVREFLKRELSAEGYRIQLAAHGREVLRSVFGDDSLDLLIIDPDFPDSDAVQLLRRIQGRIPALPVIVHTFQGEVYPRSELQHDLEVFVEKNGNSIESLKYHVSRMVPGIRARRHSSIEETGLRNPEDVSRR